METTDKRLQKVKLVLLDVDGVLTDGSIIYSDAGSEIKHFNVRDGLGIRMLLEAGIHVGIVTGRRSKALVHRCNDLGIEWIWDGVKNKAEMLASATAAAGVSPAETAFMADDLPDIALMRCVGVAVAVVDAHPAVLQAADIRTRARGGAGAVREVCERILQAQGLWQQLLEKFGV